MATISVNRHRDSTDTRSAMAILRLVHEVMQRILLCRALHQRRALRRDPSDNDAVSSVSLFEVMRSEQHAAGSKTTGYSTESAAAVDATRR